MIDFLNIIIIGRGRGSRGRNGCTHRCTHRCARTQTHTQVCTHTHTHTHVQCKPLAYVLSATKWVRDKDQDTLSHSQSAYVKEERKKRKKIVPIHLNFSPPLCSYNTSTSPKWLHFHRTATPSYGVAAVMFPAGTHKGNLPCSCLHDFTEPCAKTHVHTFLPNLAPLFTENDKSDLSFSPFLDS